MENQDYLEGVGAALVTPFDDKDNIDYESLKKLIKHVSKGKVSYLVIHGTTGEAATTSLEEKKIIVKKVIEANERKLPIILGIGGNNTKEVIKQFNNFNLDEIEAILSICPYYNKPSQEGIYQHYYKLSEESPKPIIIYNVPSRTGVNINADTTLRLSQLPNIIGIKESSGDLSQCMKIIKYKTKDFKLISGNDMDTIPIMSIGGCGVISVLANALPLHMSKVVKYCNENNYEKARKYAFDLLEIDYLMYEEGNPIGIKQLLELMWLSKAYVRKPLYQASFSLKNKINEALSSISII